MYEYRGVVTKVVDGDTVHIDVDQGLENHRFLKARLAGINAPEKNTPEGVAVKDALVAELEGVQLTVRTIKDRTEKYGRYLVVLILDDGTVVNDNLVERGMAVPYDGGRRTN